MKVLELISNLLPEKIKNNIGEKLGDGADGEVFQLSSEPDKVIKFSVIYNWFDNTTSKVEIEKEYIKIHNVLYSICNSQEDFFCKLFYVSEPIYGERETLFGSQSYVAYYQVMEKLNKISDDERRVFHTILSHEDANKQKDFTNDKLENVLNGLSYGLDFDLQKVKHFYKNVKSSKYEHKDIHIRNIMKDNFNNFKLIDFDRIKIKET